MKAPTRDDLATALVAIGQEQHAARKEIEQRREMFDCSDFARGYTLEKRAEHDRSDTLKIESLERVAVWIRAHMGRMAEREFQAKVRRSLKAKKKRVLCPSPEA
jgi:hypothetical protein